MKPKLRIVFILFVLTGILVSSGCKSGKSGHGKKPKCRTCPKWEDNIIVDAEEHGLRERP